MRVLGGMQSVNTLFTFYLQIVQFYVSFNGLG